MVDCIPTYIKHNKNFGLKRRIFLCFSDSEQILDKVDRSFLWQKLILEQISSKMIKALNAMYSVVKSYVRHRSAYSRFVHSYISLNQGVHAHRYCSCCSSMILYKILRLIPMIYSL